MMMMMMIIIIIVIVRALQYVACHQNRVTLRKDAEVVSHI